VSTAGQLLVATPLLGDPNFDRTVVLMLEHSEDGAMGLVLNRPSDLPVTDILPDWAALASQPSEVFHGGPVSTDSALALVRTSGGPVIGVRQLPHEVGVVDLDTPTELVQDAVTALRVFAGYAGWGAGQLEGEVEEGAWFVVDTLPDDAFTSDPERLWRRVLRRQPHPLSLVASFPRDPALN
jgi:putative transcriptional regulator